MSETVIKELNIGLAIVVSSEIQLISSLINEVNINHNLIPLLQIDSSNYVKFQNVSMNNISTLTPGIINLKRSNKIFFTLGNFRSFNKDFLQLDNS